MGLYNGIYVAHAYVLPSLLTCKHINTLAPASPTYHQRHWTSYWLTLFLLELTIFPLLTLSLTTTPNLSSLLFKTTICSYLYLPKFLGATYLASNFYTPLLTKHGQAIENWNEKVKGTFMRGAAKTLFIAATSGIGGLVEQLGGGLKGLKGKIKKSPSSSLRDEGRGFDVVLGEGLYVFLKIKEKYEMVILGGGVGPSARGVRFKKLDGSIALDVEKITEVREEGDVGLVIKYEQKGKESEECEVKLCETEDRDVLREGLEGYM
ncbi:hypothetical protein TrVE_jg14090 [Triparma verrucosa]|uniref:Uncharacterized protein n=1 Tax=Triparma verrucosa TaxID=1606542 RepID=A0A9W7BS51_9STRA|nr:hypothetical protein TrVE_jg14090 [Triparma verrucosa]